MRRHPLAWAAPMLAAAFLLPAGVGAQSAPRAATGAEAAAPAGASAPGEAAAPERAAERTMLQRVDSRIADLRSKLHITAAEEPQWHQFADVMRTNARAMAQKFAEREQKFRTMNAVENMQSYAGIAEQHAKNMERLVPVFQNLYNALSDQQKRTADRLWRSYAGRAGRRHKG
jgi:protein CpxP